MHCQEVALLAYRYNKPKMTLPIFKKDCKTVHIFAYSSTGGYSNKKSGVRLKKESKTGVRLTHLVCMRLLRYT